MQAEEPKQGQVTHQVETLAKNVAILLESSSALYARLEGVLSTPPEVVGDDKERSALCPIASAIADQNSKLENLNSAIVSLIRNLEI